MTTIADPRAPIAPIAAAGGGFGVATAIPSALVGLPIVRGVFKALGSAAKMF